MSRYSASDFWDCLVLQISHDQPTVRHALIALGALYEEYEVDTHFKKRLTTGTRESDTAFAPRSTTKRSSFYQQTSRPIDLQ